MPSPDSTIRDLLYLDFAKAASIWSQFDDGLLERTSVTEDATRDQSAGVRLGLPGIADARLGADYIAKRSVIESRTLHHDLLHRVEERLAEVGLVSDLAKSVAADEASAEPIRTAIGARPYLKASGTSVIEDYRRMRARTESFNGIIALVARSANESLKTTDQFKQLEQLVASEKARVATIKDRNARALQRTQAAALERKLDELATPTLTGIQPWLADGIKLWIDTYGPDRLHLRIYPFVNCPKFHVLCNLKRDCFVDSDLEHLLYGFGHRPNVALEVFGVITSLPPREESTFDPLAEFGDAESLSDRESFERAFRAVFAGMDGMEAFMRFSRYPIVTVHPIAVYRSFAVQSAAG